ncbi:hypothetical protein DSM112329_04959 [Paraconexibacter sp. AEG42_29]|uniref:Glycosyltransferase 2-like domain-containing protein n=1 Tax=Paraconexibacter sp. AEG42_29 TaxID=2997339 RepID=A0AAU7B278_9ACTN
MRPSATVILPTRHRAAYLDVALASIVPQARAAGAGVLVVDDGPSADTQAVAARHAVEYLPNDTGTPGLNVARNLGLDAITTDLAIYVDDDVRVHAGWLDALLGAAAALPDDVGVLTGPIVPVFEDHALRMCGREGAPITFLDHGPDDADVPYGWGANMAIRRSAVARVGPFDVSRTSAGDEAEWQDRFRAAGGRVRYVAAAGLDHRRAGDDSRLRSLSLAAYGRGRGARRYDVFKGTAPGLRGELRVLAGCLLHSVRYRCANGLVLAAHSWGRVREAWAPQPPPATPGVDDFLSGSSGTVGGLRGRLRHAADVVADVRTAAPRARARALAGGAAIRDAPTTTGGERRFPRVPAWGNRRSVIGDARAGSERRFSRSLAWGNRRSGPREADAHGERRGADAQAERRFSRDLAWGNRRSVPEGTGGAGGATPDASVLVVGVERPGSLMPAALDELARSRHPVIVAVGPLHPGRGKFEHLNDQLAAHALDDHDWLLVLDDDVALPPAFLDVLIDQATRNGLKLAQPAHRLHSHAAWPVTRRHGAGTRRTTFVEIGPVTLFHRDTFDTLLPFPQELRMGWGLDAHWAAVARDRGWPIGVVDAVPVGHTQAPAGAGYSREAAVDEARAFLAGRPYVTRDEVRSLESYR